MVKETLYYLFGRREGTGIVDAVLEGERIMACLPPHEGKDINQIWGGLELPTLVKGGLPIQFCYRGDGSKEAYVCSNPDEQYFLRQVKVDEARRVADLLSKGERAWALV